MMTAAVDVVDHAGVLRQDHDLAGVDRDAVLDAGADERGLRRSSGTAWRCMLEPISARLASSCSRNGISALRRRPSGAARRPCSRRSRSDVGRSPKTPSPSLVRAARWRGRTCRRLAELARLGIERRVCLRDDVLLLLVGGQVVDLVGDLAVDDLAVRGLDEAEALTRA
jgi:hypothetical protein